MQEHFCIIQSVFICSVENVSAITTVKRLIVFFSLFVDVISKVMVGQGALLMVRPPED